MIASLFRIRYHGATANEDFVILIPFTKGSFNATVAADLGLPMTAASRKLYFQILG